MKHFPIIVLAITLVFASCKSTSKLIQQGDYEKVIDKSMKQILKGKAKSEDVDLLDKAYKLANSYNHDRIKLLKSEQNPANWEQIYYQYSALDNRQKKVRKVLPITQGGKNINYPQIDYTNQIVEAKAKAADFYYSNGKKLMALNNKFNYREAYVNFSKAKKYRASAFPDIDQLMGDCKYLGTTRVLVEAGNATRTKISPDFYDKLIAINTSELNAHWTEYHLGRIDKNTDYDYMVNIVLQNILVSPERFDQKEFLREKTIQDGFSYALDSRGNVMKDSLGNDIKIPKYKDLKCTVVERVQYKDVKVEAQLEYVELYPSRRVVKLIPVAATSVFENTFGKAVGDQGALLPADKELVARNSVPFPKDIDMIYDCVPPLQNAITNIMRENRNLIK